MEELDIEKYKVVAGEETKPIIVITDTIESFERFCMQTGRDRKTAIQVSQGFQIPFYPDAEIVHYADYWLNGAYNSAEYKYRWGLQRAKALEEKENG